MYKWAEENKLLPKCQAAFRRGRSCADQIFSLSSLTYIHTRKKKRRIFATFVGFKRAFDSVDRKMLREKLDRLGVSAKKLNILNSLYSKARFLVRSKDGRTPPIEVTEGVLQGESLIPLLSSVFISDMDEFFSTQGCGLSITTPNRLSNVKVWGDAVVIGYSEGDTQSKLNILHKYCTINKLTINVGKTNVMIISKKAIWSKTNFRFMYNGQEVEKVAQYTYLGVPLTNSGPFTAVSKHFKNRGIQAINAINAISFKGKIQNWEPKLKLFDVCIASCILN